VQCSEGAVLDGHFFKMNHGFSVHSCNQSERLITIPNDGGW
jgi:hypothetical protein